jgi:Tol biopolymer transport system component
MPLSAGVRLGPYEVIAPLGAGGMGEVYKARDTRLERTVAVKVLPHSLAADPEFRARFEREAKSISALNHPHICTLHDVGRARVQGTAAGEEIDFLVMEHLEGETLAARLTRGPLPSDQALAYAMQIADALDKAHRQGIVHRDLKPANVFLVKGATASGPGICKLLDFGLAKVGAVAAAGSVETALFSGAGLPANGSPARGTTPLTAQGAILGTFQYMAPEQIEGHDADARTDIWAFGCVLYEMLTGRRAFEGRSQASLIASILERQPTPIAELQPLTPPALGRLVRTCLEKHPDDRFHTAHDLALHLRWIDEGGSAAGLPAPVVAGRKRRERLLLVTGAIVLAALAAAAAWLLKPAPERSAVVGRFTMPLGEGQSFTRVGRRVVAISPDGTKVAYIADSRIYLRRMHETEAQPIRGTNVDPVDLAFSPDGEWLAFFAPGTPQGPLDTASLKKIPIAGGTPMLLTQAGSPHGLRWQGDTLVFSTGRTVQAIADTGGAARTLLTVETDSNELVSQPSLLNGGRDLLYTVRMAGVGASGSEVVVQPVAGGPRRSLIAGVADARVLPSGQLVYISDNTLHAVAFDPRGLQIAGGSIPLVEGVRFSATTRVGQFDVAENGTLVFIPGESAVAFKMVWVDRSGREETIGAPAQLYYIPRISPDGKQIAVSSVEVEDRKIWIWDDPRKTLTRLTTEAREENYPLWSPDGRFVYYRANPDGNFDVFRRAADGTGAVERLTRSPEAETPLALLPGGGGLLVRRGRSVADVESTLAILPLSADPKPAAVLNVPSSQVQGEISPDGRWLLYQSGESSTQDEIWVRPFPAIDSGRWKVSTNGGQRPMWARSGREIFFRGRHADADHFMVVPVMPVRAGEAFSYGTPTPLLNISRYSFLSIGRTYDISPDDRRFLFLLPEGREADTRDSLTVIVNWDQEVRARVK